MPEMIKPFGEVGKTPQQMQERLFAGIPASLESLAQKWLPIVRDGIDHAHKDDQV